MPSETEIEKFVRWFVTPVQVLRGLPSGDGAFVALSIAFTLFERYYRIETGTQDDHRDESFKNREAEDLNVNKEFFIVFWSTYRNGLLHQGNPKIYVNANRKHKWLISHEFDEFPTYFDKRGFRIICIDPWKFYDFILDKVYRNRKALKGILSYRLGKIYDSNNPPLRTSVALGQTYQR